MTTFGTSQDDYIRKLIADRDALLEALKNACNALEHEGYPEHGWILTEGRAAIAKATE